MTVRAKFLCQSVTAHAGGSKSIEMMAACTRYPSDENKDFADATPSGNFKMMVNAGRPAGDAFTPGKHYYFDISEAAD